MIHIACTGLFDGHGHNRNLGGIESYIYTLAETLSLHGYLVKIYQYSDCFFCVDCGGFDVIGTETKSDETLLKWIQAQKSVDLENDILIFSTDFMIVQTKFKNTVAIQHGIAWDITSEKKVSRARNYAAIFKGTLRTLKKYQRYRYCRHLVCVDYNFVNWYRTQVAYIDAKLHVIPNYSKIPDISTRTIGKAERIIFARRLVEYRGTRIFTAAIKGVLAKHPEISVTVAGKGPEESWMREALKQYSNVTFTSYTAEESLEVHQKHDIAVVPTMGSEGTSLSLLEAMASGCAVIATDVGGITNVLIDGYNGVLISPDASQLANALNNLIENRERREILAMRAYDTILNAFSYDKWAKKWIAIIEQIEEG